MLILANFFPLALGQWPQALPTHLTHLTHLTHST